MSKSEFNPFDSGLHFYKEAYVADEQNQIRRERVEDVSRKDVKESKRKFDHLFSPDLHQARKLVRQQLKEERATKEYRNSDLGKRIIRVYDVLRRGIRKEYGSAVLERLHPVLRRYQVGGKPLTEERITTLDDVREEIKAEYGARNSEKLLECLAGILEQERHRIFPPLDETEIEKVAQGVRTEVSETNACSCGVLTDELVHQLVLYHIAVTRLPEPIFDSEWGSLPDEVQTEARHELMELDKLGARVEYLCSPNIFIGDGLEYESAPIRDLWKRTALRDLHSLEQQLVALKETLVSVGVFTKPEFKAAAEQLGTAYVRILKSSSQLRSLTGLRTQDYD
jgi:hypothetical protein